ncbi:MAG: hypothetical protein L6R30_00265 [Thermoanaerobaculia bacterium]|nr:hypothetical protein [Thermoanaerobaculia bacterium]MCK6680833.1 hypothetical protein [Thermoanaerobaculia bacterium]
MIVPEPSASLLKIHEHLSNEGFRPSFHEGEISFKFQGRVFFISHDDSDAEFFRLLYPHFWTIESQEEKQAALAAASETCKTLKVAKAFLVEDEVWASVELFCSDADAFLAVLERSTSLLYETANVFRHHYNSLSHEHGDEETGGPESDDDGHDHEEGSGDPTSAPKKEEPHH